MDFTSYSLFLAIFLEIFACQAQQPNTDGFYISDFLRKMGASDSNSINEGSSAVCSWSSVVCDSKQDKIISFSASGLGLSGAIPENTIGKLEMLQSLDLSMNSITSFSSDFWSLGGSLKSLNLSSNNISSSLPENIANFGVLEVLDLSRNRFSGDIPAGLSSASKLVHLDFSDNSFEGKVPDFIFLLKNLESVNLARNKLNGALTDHFGTNLKNLRALDLSGNQIHDRIPNISGLVKLKHLNLSNNLFQGSVLGVLQQNLEVIDLSNNQLQGHLPEVNWNPSFNWSTLAYLDLSVNQLSGEFISDWSRAQSLIHLNLAFNRFSHQKFPQIEKITGLEYLNLSKTSIADRIPVEVSQLVNLRIIDLSQNHLSGKIPDMSADKLQVLDLSMNNLTGEIPPSLQLKLPSMEKFNFSYNNISFCASSFFPKLFQTEFIGAQNDCPIAVNPEVIKEHRNRTSRKGFKLALAIALSVFFVVLALFCLMIGFKKRTRGWATKQLSYREEQNISGPFSFQTDSTTWVADVKTATSVPVIIFEKPLLNFTFADLLNATSHFDRGTLLAEGRFGPVYRGFLPGGIHVAVKVLVHGTTLTDQEAAKELERLGRIKHPNLVPLSGYCLAGDQRIAIYDYMENGNLQNLLHDLPLGLQTTEDWADDAWEDDQRTTQGLTTWRFRHKIALGTARALSFLHHGCFPQIIHKDVKASSVYLDSELEPRLSDFGLAKVVGSTLEDEISRGSPGYSPPEFSDSENIEATAKSDVYCFGVILFELITGKKPLNDEYPDGKETSLVGWARALVRKGEGSKAIDPKIRQTGSEKQMEQAMRIAYLCTADLPSKRPTMQQIVGLLKDIEHSIAEL